MKKTRNGGERLTDSERALKWKRENPEQFKATQRAYRERLKVEDPERLALKYRKRNLRTKYGLSLEDYDNMCISQNHVCYICHKSEPNNHRLAVDHCHTSNKVRKLLCKRCNLTVEHIENAQTDLQKYLDYIDEHK